MDPRCKKKKGRTGEVINNAGGRLQLERHGASWTPTTARRRRVRAIRREADDGLAQEQEEVRAISLVVTVEAPPYRGVHGPDHIARNRVVRGRNEWVEEGRRELLVVRRCALRSTHVGLIRLAGTSWRVDAVDAEREIYVLDHIGGAQRCDLSGRGRDSSG